MTPITPSGDADARTEAAFNHASEAMDHADRSTTQQAVRMFLRALFGGKP